jgi:predicted short-subunit dehydrogenase-like oxidoreductase (DUF2520 family)
MATVLQVQLLAPIQLTASDAPLYTTPALNTAKIGRAVFCNTDTVVHTITINISSTTSSAANQVISARALSPGETYVSPELAGAVLPPGFSVRGLADTAAKVTVTISGILIQ